MSLDIQEGGALVALRDPEFRLYLLGQTVSMVGTWVQTTALSWVVYELTESSLMLGSVNFVTLLPFVPLALAGGAISDRVSKRNLLLVTTSIGATQAFLLGALTLSGHLKIWHIFLLVFLLGAANSVETGARFAFVAEISSKGSLSSALGIAASLWSLAVVIGPGIAGVLLETLGAGGCFMLNALTFLLAGVTLLKIRSVPPQEKSLSGGSWMGSGEVVEFIVQRREVVGTLLLVTLSALLSFSFVTLLPAFASDALGGGAGEFSVLTALFGTGCAAGALFFARRGDIPRGKLFVLGRLVAPLAIIVLASIRSFAAAGAVLVVVGIFVISQNSVGEVLIQNLAPDRLRGRVMAIYALLAIGALRLGGVVLGASADHLGLRPTMVVSSVVGFIACAVVAAAFPEVRRL